MTARPRKTKRL